MLLLYSIATHGLMVHQCGRHLMLLELLLYVASRYLDTNYWYEFDS
jgi:hypothetical protein